MKKFIFLCVLIFISIDVNAQLHKQSDTLKFGSKPIISVDKANILENVDVIANMQYANNNDFQDGKYTSSNFAMNQFRLEVKGMVLDSTVFFRFRDRYTRTPTVQSVDNVDHSVDMAFVGINLSNSFSIAFGKMCADYGGYEFDANPIDIYQYNDIVEEADNFLTGAQFTWNTHNNQQFTFQVLNARTKTFSELYNSVPDVNSTKFPAAFVGNWRGSFADGLFSTFWSYSFITEASEKQVQYIALGNQLNLKKVLIQYDFKYMKDDLDRLGVITSLIPESYSPYTALKTSYVEHWLRVQYNFSPQWNFSLIGMVSDSYWKGNPDETVSNDHIRTAWGVIPSLEFYPFKKLNLKFFASYVGRDYNYSNTAKSIYDLEDSTTGKVMLGFIAPLKFL
ncbi:OprO/OprP family phosphate-selective porin [Cellulophaga sp. 20_2_10]|uniref:porin n=1 Tax=Cellulophaga sp. 20_2_10 TaxID=2942476 RepID=UPI00201AE22F|nr:porin [Cellulophaga sp. 20_2_10]MCL5245457.1 OprO/OprP family phosphate-selective porin [Cellulophaga sp. 20_2_10]